VIAGRQEHGLGEQFGEFNEFLHVLGERSCGFAVGLDLPATGFVLGGGPLALLADADVLADDAAIFPSGAGVIGSATSSGFPRHTRLREWCKLCLGAHNFCKPRRARRRPDEI
jgi:hypothetical protein